ncbi:hypothetical protein [Lactiplantibacillus argentoratensis]|uniref:hypothetical protein n=1 Tax=Lactiplantibacillus argentoratensis TaxID=271881 RepID=UPI003EB825CD
MNENIFKQEITKFLDSITNKQDENTSGMTMGQGYFFWYSEIYLANAVEIIIEDSKLGKLFSWKNLQEKIVKLTGEGKAKNEADTQIIEDILGLINKKPEEFLCIIPFHGIKLESPYTIGNVTLYPASQKKSVLKSKVNDKLYDELIDTVTDKQNFATVNIQAVIPSGAIEVAILEVKSTLNILKFLMNEPNVLYQIGVGKQNKTMFDKEFIAVNQNSGITQHPFQYMPRPAELSNLQPFGKSYVKRIGDIQLKIYSSQSTVPLEKGLVNATNLIASGLDSEDPTIQIIQLMSAIEALVEQKTFVQGITDQVCERAALLLGKDSTSRRRIFDRLTTLYGKRSNLSHGNTAVITHYDVIYLWQIAQNLCFYFHMHFDDFIDSNKHEKAKLKDYLLNLRFEGK